MGPEALRVAGIAPALEERGLRVVDRGPGIPEDRRDGAFEPFQRQDDSPSGGASVGLGLAIARGFAEAMGGSVSAEETPGGGATLVVRLGIEPATAVVP